MPSISTDSHDISPEKLDHAITSPALPTMTGGVRYLPQRFHYRRETSGEADHFDEHWKRRIADQSLFVQGPSVTQRSRDRTTGIVLRGAESLLTHRWRDGASAAQEPMVCGLSAGGNRIRTIGPARERGGRRERPRGPPSSSRETTG